jgi:hypothetical protein
MKITQFIKQDELAWIGTFNRLAMFMNFNMEFSDEEMKVSSGSIIVFFCFIFPDLTFLYNFILMLRIQISCHVSFISTMSEYLAYILKTEIPKSKLNRNSTEVAEG